MAENNDWPEKLKNIKAKSTGPRLKGPNDFRAY
jgi:hypothetical protein